MFSESKYPKNILFYFEKGSTEGDGNDSTDSQVALGVANAHVDAVVL